MDGLRVDLEFAHQREARTEESTDVAIRFDRDRVVVAVVAARDVAAVIVHAAEADAEAPRETPGPIMEAARKRLLRPVVIARAGTAVVALRRGDAGREHD